MQYTVNRRLCNFLYILIFILGLFFAAFALRMSVSFFTEYVVGDPSLDPQMVKRVRSLRLASFGTGSAIIALALFLRRKRALESRLKDRSFSIQNALVNLSLFFISSVSSLVLLEVGLRVIGQGQFTAEVLNPERAVFWHYDSLLGWEHLPNQEGRLITPDSDVHVQINAQGLRDRPYSYRRPEGVYRIVVLGDSFTWGFGVEQDQIFTEIMEGGQENLQVINMGVSGYSTDQEYLFLREEGLKYDPQLVLLMLFDDDIAHNALDVNFFVYPKPRFSAAGGQLVLASRPSRTVGPLRRLHGFLRTHLVTYNHLVRVFRYNPAGPIKFTRELASGMMLWLTGRVKERPLELTLAILDEMRALSEASGAQLVIVKIATHDQALEFSGPKPGALPEYCRANDIRFLDLAEPFQEYLRSHGSESLQFAHDQHWNVNAHKLAAEIIYSYLQAESLLPPQ